MRRSLVPIVFLVSLLVFSSFAFAQTRTLNLLGISGWTPSELALKMAPAFEEYAREKLGYEVRVTADFAPFTALYEKAAAALAARSSQYDIIISDSQWLGAFAEPGHLIQLNEFFETDPVFKSILESMYPEHITAYMPYPDHSDTYWGFPQVGDNLVMYVRKDLLEDPKEQADFEAKYGYPLPQTYEDFAQLDWDTFVDLMEFFTRPPELYGFAGEYSKEYDFMSGHAMSMIWTWGGDIIDWDTYRVNGVINSPEANEAMEFYRDILKYQPPGAITYGIDQVINALATGQVFAGITWAAVGASIFDPSISVVHDKLMVVLPPGKLIDGELNRLYCVGGQSWVISKYSENKDVALDFMRWWYQPETQMEFARLGGLPVVRSIIDTEEFLSMQPWHRAYKDMIPLSLDFWHLPNYAELLQIQQEEWTAFVADSRITAKQAHDNIARRQEMVLRRDGFLK